MSDRYDKLKPHHILIFKHDDGKQIISVAIDKREGKWGIFGSTYLPLRGFRGWTRFLKRRGFVIWGTSLSEMQEFGAPVLAVKPGSTKDEALDGVAWFIMELHKEEL